MKNLFITFEGIDGCGKSTQAARLYERLRAESFDVDLYREPGGTLIGEKIRDMLLDSSHVALSPLAELFLYLAARAQITSQRILPSLNKGAIVILDRFIDSSASYQGYARGLGPDLVRYLNRIATGGLVPDITFLFDCDVALAFSRMKTSYDRLESEGEEFMRRVREGFLSLSRDEPSRFVVLDGSDSMERLHDCVYREVINRCS